jgi:hypothetical protein
VGHYGQIPGGEACAAARMPDMSRTSVQIPGEGEAWGEFGRMIV